MDLKKKFDELIEGKVSQSKGDELFIELEKNYSGKFYHSFEHIKKCFEEFEEIKHLLKNPIEVGLAIFYHDVIYDVSRKDSEERSAKLAKERLLENGFSKDSANNIYELIMVTGGHKPSPNSDSKYIIDIDLSSLGYSRGEFVQNSENIKKEYSIVPNFTVELFDSGRKTFLNDFLKRERIFCTGYFFEKYEMKARENIQRYLDSI